MKKSRSLGDYVDDDVINKAKKEKQKYQNYLKKDDTEKSNKKEFKKRKKMDIQSYIVFLLSRREYSEKEIRVKLKNREHTEEEINKGIEWAKESGFQSDERYVRSQIKYRSHKNGNRKLLMEMKQKGINEEIIKDAIEELEPEVNRAIDALNKFKNKQEDPKVKEKAFRSLASKGFSYGVIKEAWAILFEDKEWD